jgi:hypothetical protein
MPAKQIWSFLSTFDQPRLIGLSAKIISVTWFLDHFHKFFYFFFGLAWRRSGTFSIWALKLCHSPFTVHRSPFTFHIHLWLDHLKLSPNLIIASLYALNWHAHKCPQPILDLLFSSFLYKLINNKILSLFHGQCVSHVLLTL